MNKNQKGALSTAVAILVRRTVIRMYFMETLLFFVTADICALVPRSSLVVPCQQTAVQAQKAQKAQKCVRFWRQQATNARGTLFASSS